MPKPDNTARLDLQALCDRLVPSTVDLTTRGAQFLTDTGAIVQQTDAQPTGTGVIRSFVRVQGAAPGGGSEQGYNTDARPLQFDENKSPQFTRSMTVGAVPVVTVNGVNYREFLLDINQKASASKLSLDNVQIFLGDRPDLTGYDATAKTLAGHQAVFELNPDGSSPILLDARLNSGSGSGDMKLLVPDSAFTGASVNTYLYLYSHFGGVAGATANGGFEEWAARNTGTPVAPPSLPSSLSGFVYLDVNGNGVMDEGDTGIGGVTVKLDGVDANGNTVTMVTTTFDDGSYRFDGLQAGKYTIWEEQPAGYEDGAETLGSLGGTISANDLFSDIVVPGGAKGVNYNFGELLDQSVLT